jgi:hypothetical protein
MRKTIAHSLLLPLCSGVIKFDNPIDVTDDEERVSDEAEDDDAVGVFMVNIINLFYYLKIIMNERQATLVPAASLEKNGKRRDRKRREIIFYSVLIVSDRIPT